MVGIRNTLVVLSVSALLGGWVFHENAMLKADKKLAEQAALHAKAEARWREQVALWKSSADEFKKAAEAKEQEASALREKEVEQITVLVKTPVNNPTEALALYENAAKLAVSQN